MSSVLYQYLLSHALQHFKSSETGKPRLIVASPARLSAWSFSSTPACLAQYICTGGFEGGCRKLSHAKLGFPFQCSLFVVNSVNVSLHWDTADADIKDPFV